MFDYQHIILVDGDNPDRYFKYWSEKDVLYEDVLIRTDKVERFWGFNLRTIRVGYVDFDDSSLEESSVASFFEEAKEGK